MREFIRAMLSNQDNISSKRTTGILLILAYISVIYIYIFKQQYELAFELSKIGFYGALGLLGVAAVIEKILKK